MKILAQIPLLLFVLITYTIVALMSPEWLNISQPVSAQPVPQVQVQLEDESAEDPAAVDFETPTSDELFAGSKAKPVFLMKLVSGATWGMTLGEMIIAFALFLLFIEVIKSTRTSNASIIDHMLSTIVFMVHLVLFLIWRPAGTGVFFILTIISLIDIMCGFTVSIASARRDVSLGTGSV